MCYFLFHVCNHDVFIFFFSSRRRHTRFDCDWSSDVCSSDLPSSAAKYNALLNTVKPLGEELAPVVGLMSVTRTVPVPVRSVCHTSTPWTPSSPAKYRALLNTVKPYGEEHKGTWIPPMNPEPGAMSFTCTVPPSVPSVLHSSRPLPPSSAEKYKALLNTVKPLGE